jgi:hypothetical protein
MDKKPRKRGHEAYTRSPTLIYTTSCKEDKGRERTKSREKDHKKRIKGERDCQKKVYCQGVYPFPLMSKGERKLEA